MNRNKRKYQAKSPMSWMSLIGVLFMLLFCVPTFGQADSAQATAKQEEGAAKKKAGLVSKLFKKVSGDAKKAKAAAKKAKALEKASKDSLQVFGWHASWLGNTFQDYNFNALTTLSYFSCTMTRKEDTVLNYNTPGWSSGPVSQLIKLAEGDDCNVLLTLKSHDQDAITLLLDDTVAQQQNIDILFHLIDTAQAVNGVNVVFEGVPLSHSGQLTNYIKRLSEALKKEGKILVLSLPAIDFGNKYDIKSLNNYVDQFVVMGYNYYHSKSKKAGPVAPLEGNRKWGRFHLKRSVRDYVKAGLPKKKFILAMPYYGAVWTADTLKNGQVRHRFHDHWRFNKIQKKIKHHKVDYDSVSHTAHVVVRENGKTYHCYFDNAKSLKHKYNWVKKQGLAGIGVWALGYDHGHKQLWENIEKNIKVVKIPPVSYEVDTLGTATAGNSSSDSATVAATADSTAAAGEGKGAADKLNEVMNQVNPTSFLKKYEDVLTNEKVLVVAIVTLLIFVILGVLKSLFYEEVYNKLLITDFKTYLKVSLVFMFVFASILMTLKLIFDDTLLLDEVSTMSGAEEASLYQSIRNKIIIIGVIIWLIIQALSIKTFLKFNKDLP